MRRRHVVSQPGPGWPIAYGTKLCPTRARAVRRVAVSVLRDALGPRRAAHLPCRRRRRSTTSATARPGRRRGHDGRRPTSTGAIRAASRRCCTASRSWTTVGARSALNETVLPGLAAPTMHVEAQLAGERAQRLGARVVGDVDHLPVRRGRTRRGLPAGDASRSPGDPWRRGSATTTMRPTGCRPVPPPSRHRPRLPRRDRSRWPASTSDQDARVRA